MNRETSTRPTRALRERVENQFRPPPIVRSGLHAVLGEDDQAIRALENKGPGIFYMKLHPFFDPLREDPRFERLLEQAGLDEASVEKTLRELGEPLS